MAAKSSGAAPGDAASAIDRVDPSDLLALALSTPAAALIQAQFVIDEHHDDVSVSYAHQAAGIVFRDFGDLSQAFRHLRAGLRAAGRSGDVDREIDVRATLGGTLVVAGRTASGLTQLDAAAVHAHGLLLAKVRLRRGNVLSVLGRYDEALTDLRLAMTSARRNGDRLWEARALHNRTMTYLALGSLNRADADAIAAELLFDEIGQAWESVQASHNRAIVAIRRGDIPAALRLLDLAEARYQSIGVAQPDLFVDRGHALLAAGLAAEAVATAEQVLDGGKLKPVMQAELSLFCARAAIAAGLPEQARARAKAAGALFRTQQRPRWQLRARLAEYEARYLAGERTTRLATASSDVAAAADQLPEEEQPLSHLLAARLAHARKLPADAHLVAAAKYRLRGSALTRATGWLAVAMRAAASDRSPLRACGRGLDALDEHRLLFGAAEIRAFATLHSRDLADLALDAVISGGSAKQLLQWSERVRATSLAEPSVRPVDDGESERELAAVRDSVRRIEEAYASGATSVLAHQQRDAGEAAVRRRHRHLSGETGPAVRFDSGRLQSMLGDTQLLTLVENRGELYAVLARDGRLRRFYVGPARAVGREIQFAQFALRRAAHSRTAKPINGDALQAALLGPAARWLDGPVVVVPPASLHAVPWGMLPALAELPTSAAPSAAMWMRATAVAASAVADRRVLLVAGPDLASRGTEVGQLAAVHRRTTMLGAESAADRPATVDAVLEAMNGAWIAHFAAHGSFRTDSPLFSSLRLDDGALFVHDFDRLRRAPRTVILSACDTGVSAAVGADELLGLVTGLLRVGAAGVVASVVPVNDAATIPFMITVHRALAAGQPLAAAALAGRLAARGDPVTAATAASFSVWGG